MSWDNHGCCCAQGSLEFAQQLEVLVGYLLPCIRAQSSNLHGGDDGSQRGALVRMQVAALAALREYILYWCAAPPFLQSLALPCLYWCLRLCCLSCICLSVQHRRMRCMLYEGAGPAQYF